MHAYLFLGLVGVFFLTQHKLKQVKDIIVKPENEEVEVLRFIQQLNVREENLFYLAGCNVLTCKFHSNDSFFSLVLSHY